MSVNTKMTAIANEVRTISGTTETLGLDAMASNLITANSYVGAEADLIAQITSALEGKAAGGGSTTYDTCTVNLTVPNGRYIGHSAVCFENGEIVYKDNIYNTEEIDSILPPTIENVICGSHISFWFNLYNGVILTSGVTTICESHSFGGVYEVSAAPNTTATIEVGQHNDGGGSA